jgi:hypothetical protein
MITEDVTYWFFRLNGCLTVQNFIVHPDSSGGQRTDADLIAVRFPYRAELLTSGRPMQDHPLFEKRLQLFFVEVKTGACRINGPWTDREKRNIDRVLNAVGIVPPGDEVDAAAMALYERGRFSDERADIRLVLVGSSKDERGCGLSEAAQLTYDEILGFIHQRMVTYAAEKAAHQQWDSTGRDLYHSATSSYRNDLEGFKQCWKSRVRH